MSSVERLWLAAWLEGLRHISPAPAVRLAELPPRPIPLDDTGRAPTVPLRPTGGGDGRWFGGCTPSSLSGCRGSCSHVEGCRHA